MAFQGICLKISGGVLCLPEVTLGRRKIANFRQYAKIKRQRKAKNGCGKNIRENNIGVGDRGGFFGERRLSVGARFGSFRALVRFGGDYVALGKIKARIEDIRRLRPFRSGRRKFRHFFRSVEILQPGLSRHSALARSPLGNRRDIHHANLRFFQIAVS